MVLCNISDEFGALDIVCSISIVSMESRSLSLPLLNNCFRTISSGFARWTQIVPDRSLFDGRMSQ